MGSIKTEIPLVVSLEVNQSLFEKSDLETLTSVIGGKGGSLWELSQWDMPVPDFCCITSMAFTETLKNNGLMPLIKWLDNPNEQLPFGKKIIDSLLRECEIPEEIQQQVSAFIVRFPGEAFAVRSSGTIEDGVESSFAGLFETVLNVRSTDDIFDAIKSCWISLFNERVQSYLERQPLTEPLGIALVIQRMIASEKSGVLFTVDPVRGVDKEMLVEACFGLGEALVSGHVTPDQYRYDWYNGKEVDRVIAAKEVQCVQIDTAPFVRIEDLDEGTSNAPVLTKDDVRELAEIGLQIQVRSGYPVDIEWAKFNDELYILQSRPITQLGYASIEGEWTTADFRDGGVSSSVCTPYMASLYKSVIDFSMGGYLDKIGLGDKAIKVWQLSFYGRPYWNLGAAKEALARIPGFNERNFDQGLGIAPNYDGDGVVSKSTIKTIVTGVKALYSIRKNCKEKLKENPKFSEKQHKHLVELADIDFGSMPDKELFTFCETFIKEEYFHNESIYFDFIYENSNLNSLFKEQVDKLSSFDKSLFSLLLSGLSGVSHLAQVEALWALREEIEADASVLTYWTENSVSEICEDITSNLKEDKHTGIKQYLKKFGHHSQKELDLTVPRYSENPEYGVKELKSILTQDVSSDPRLRNKKQHESAVKAQEALVSAAPFGSKKLIQSRLNQVREFLWWREELRDLSTRFYFFVRKISLEVEKRLLKTGALLAEGDIFFLEISDLFKVMNGENSHSKTQAIIQRNKDYYHSFASFVIPDEVGQRYGAFGGVTNDVAPVTAGDGVLAGVAGSPGSVTGVARVIRDINDADRLQPGDILVTRCTDPGWTPKFSMLSGVITETGGVLSHAAVICREYGMPAVLAIKNATKLIREGDVITLNGATGQVILPGTPKEQSESTPKESNEQLEASI